MGFHSTERRRQIITVGVAVVLAAVMAAALIMGFRLATQMRGNVAALQTASTLQVYPDLLTQQLTSLRDRLEARAYAGQALTDFRATIERFAGELQRLVADSDEQTADLVQAQQIWHQYEPVFKSVLEFSAQPYIESDDAGSAFSDAGLQYYGDVKRAQFFSQESSAKLKAALNTVATQLQDRASLEANRLRLLLSAGVLAALALAAVAAYLQLTRGRSEHATREAQAQTRDILNTVKEGFFLLDADYRIGAVWSQALIKMFGRDDFSGLAFDDLLKNLVPSATLATATKYVKLLWGDRAHESLMKSINPLGQLEISIENARGGRDTRYLQFDFHRVMGEKGVKHVLVSVTDITSSVILAQELHELQGNANRQVDMMLGVMHIEPLHLTSFLDNSEASLAQVNTILRDPARNDREFRGKLDGLIRELHLIKGEASAINLTSAAQRVHALESMVSELKQHPDLTGKDFLPVVLKLDELLMHLRSIRELATRLMTLRNSTATDRVPPEIAALALRERVPGTREGESGKTAAGLAQTLTALAERLAKDHDKKFSLKLHGLSDIPPAYQQLAKDVLIQMLRNAAVHGIESANVRQAQAKVETGSIRVEFRKTAAEQFLVFEDDGAGLLPDHLRATAVRKQLVTAEEAATMDTRAALALIFRPGFTTEDHVSMDAGRGVGMDVIARHVQAAGGRIGVNTAPGKFTRFRITLPATPEGSAAVA